MNVFWRLSVVLIIVKKLFKIYSIQVKIFLETQRNNVSLVKVQILNRSIHCSKQQFNWFEQIRFWKTLYAEDPWDHMPYTSLGKPGEQIGIFDRYVGNVMKRLHDLDVADNTLVFFTSDNGPDQGESHSNNLRFVQLSIIRHT